MSEKLTHQDQLVDYNQRICNKILSSREVMALIANDPDLDLDSPEAAQWEDHIIDHAWVDDTVQESGAFVTVDVDVTDMCQSRSGGVDRRSAGPRQHHPEYSAASDRKGHDP